MFKKGAVPWNKGKTHSEKSKEKMRKNHADFSGENNPMFGRSQTQETRKKISEVQKDNKSRVGKPCTEETRKKISKSLQGRKLSEETKKKISKSCSGKTPWNKGKTIAKISGKNNPMFGKTHSKEARKKISESRLLTLEKIQQRYPTFFREEEMRYNPDKPGEIQVHCKNHNCPNSKEQGGWFTPTGQQFDDRRRALEDKNGSDGAYLYCSDECKNACPLYKFQFRGQEVTKPYTREEYQTFRQYVLKRDNYKCQYCGETAEHVHHEKPQKLEPFFALDPDYAWSCCKECHYKYGHKDECSTSKLANMFC